VKTDDKKDRLYSKPLENVGGFEFDEPVADVFPDMISRSVPAYTTIVRMIGQLAGQYAQENSNCYDLGCSLGATSMAIVRNVADKNCSVIAVDNSEAMLARFREQVGENVPGLLLRCEDIRNTDYKRASFVSLNFTLQFLPLDDRLLLLDAIRENMLPGGALVLSEKVTFETSREDRFHDEAHTFFKRANGYSELEISQKRAALENVLIRESVDQHRSRLKQAGFSQCYVWFQCFNFVSLIAICD